MGFLNYFDCLHKNQSRNVFVSMKMKQFAIETSELYRYNHTVGQTTKKAKKKPAARGCMQNRIHNRNQSDWSHNAKIH